MINFIFGFLMAFPASARVPLAESKYPIQSVQDHELLPDVHTTYYSTSTERYTAFTQFYRRKGKVLGRYCRLDRKGDPVDCIAIIPNESKKTCSIEQYKEEQKIKMSESHFTTPHCHRILAQHKIDTLKEGIRVCKGIRQANVDKAGSPRKVGLPQGKDKLITYSEAIVVPEYRRAIEIEKTIFEGKIACKRYFGQYGVKQRTTEAMQKSVTPKAPGGGSKSRALK